jgi:hypothetical protein
MTRAKLLPKTASIDVDVVVAVSSLPPHGVVVVTWCSSGMVVMINKNFKRKITRAQTTFRSFVPMWGRRAGAVDGVGDG